MLHWLAGLTLVLSAADHWTTSGAKPHTAIVAEHGHRVMKAAEQVAGGGEQFFLPEAWKYLQPF